MRLYLSSYRLGNAQDLLVKLVDKRHKVAIIENALDLYSPGYRADYKLNVYDPYREFTAYGMRVIRRLKSFLTVMPKTGSLGENHKLLIYHKKQPILMHFCASAHVKSLLRRRITFGAL